MLPYTSTCLTLAPGYLAPLLTASGNDYPPTRRVAGHILRATHTELLPLLRGVCLGTAVQADPRLAQPHGVGCRCHHRVHKRGGAARAEHRQQRLRRGMVGARLAQQDVGRGPAGRRGRRSSRLQRKQRCVDLQWPGAFRHAPPWDAVLRPSAAAGGASL